MTFQFGKRLILPLLCLVLIQFQSVSSKRSKENPVKYYTVLRGPPIQFGTDEETQKIVVTREEATSSVRELHTETESSNQITTSAEISAVYGGFSASVSAGFTHDTRSLNASSETWEKRIINSVENTYNLKGAGKVFATLVEMDMYVFKVGKRKEYIKVPTGITIASVLDKQNIVLQDLIYDRSVNSFAKLLNLKHKYSEQEIRDIVPEDLIPEVNAQRFPKTDVYYRLKNKVQPFTWLKYWKGMIVGCAPWSEIYSGKVSAKVPPKNRDDELWKFEKYGKRFVIYSKRYYTYRLGETEFRKPNEEQRYPGLHGGKIGRDQQVSVKVVDEAKNMVKIKMVQSKRWLSMWKEWKKPEPWHNLNVHLTCGFEKNPSKDENIWILEPVQ